MRVREQLRQAGAPWHEAVDAAFSRFDLGQADGYRAFLRAHARALPGLEQALEQAGIAQLMPDWPARRRRHALLADLADLGLPPPPTAAPRLDADRACSGAWPTCWKARAWAVACSPDRSPAPRLTCPCATSAMARTNPSGPTFSASWKSTPTTCPKPTWNRA